MQELVIHKYENKKNIMLVEDGILRELYEENEENIRLEGNIYLGIVKDVFPGMQAAFVDIGEGKNSYIHIKDIIPKMSEITGNKEENLSQYPIQKYIKKQDCLLVQVRKDENHHKGARLTTHIHIPGKYVIFMTECSFITISQKIEKQEEKDRLKKIVQEIAEQEQIHFGFVIRTAAEGKDKTLIEQDIQDVLKKWNYIQKRMQQLKQEHVPAIIEKQTSIIEKIIIDVATNGLSKIWVDSLEVKAQVEKILQDKHINEKIDIMYQEKNLIKMYDLNEQMEKAKNRKIWLNCGGFVTIDKTEALTAIDVNSGKFTGSKTSKDLEKTILRVNEEATIEIAKQLRLKDIGGIIVIDYIDMQDQKNKERIIELLKQNLKKDRSKTQIMDFTKLNLLEMTRKQMFIS